jgi:hypothetical protein
VNHAGAVRRPPTYSGVDIEAPLLTMNRAAGGRCAFYPATARGLFRWLEGSLTSPWERSHVPKRIAHPLSRLPYGLSLWLRSSFVRGRYAVGVMPVKFHARRDADGSFHSRARDHVVRRGRTP